VVAIPLVVSHFELRAGQVANSLALIADARGYRAHVFITGIVFTALLAQRFNFLLDRIVAITKMGWDLLADGMRVLLDASLDTATLLSEALADVGPPKPGEGGGDGDSAGSGSEVKSE